VDTPVYDRYALAAGARVEGPAIVEERESTTVLPPGAAATVDEYASLVAELE
jgi:N-methylhydantoinase A